MNTDRDQAGTVPQESKDPRGTADSVQATEAAKRRRSREAGKKKRTPLGMVIEIVVIVAAAFAIAMLVQAFIVKPFTIHQVSMQPTLVEGDRILLNRMSYHFRDPERGDVVVFHSPMTQGEDLVKRVIGVPGDQVAVRDGSLYVNGVLQEEPYVLENEILDDDQEVLVPPDKVFVMGDNRNNSGDSRFFGSIDIDSIIGCAFCVYWPIGHWRGL